MSDDYLPKKDKDLQAWLNNFVTIANANLPALGITVLDMGPITSDQTSFTGAIATLVTAKDTLKSATQGKNQVRKKAVNDIRALVRRIQANPTVQPPLKSSLGLNPRTVKPSRVTPVTPAGLTVAGYSNGDNVLDWSANGNKAGTNYLVEAKFGAATNFVQVSAGTATRFTHSGQTPGAKVTYRIVAKRRNLVSSPSDTASVYDGAATVGLTLSKAA